jgi:hypothetical protein
MSGFTAFREAEFCFSQYEMNTTEHEIHISCREKHRCEQSCSPWGSNLALIVSSKKENLIFIEAFQICQYACGYAVAFQSKYILKQI